MLFFKRFLCKFKEIRNYRVGSNECDSGRFNGNKKTGIVISLIIGIFSVIAINDCCASDAKDTSPLSSQNSSLFQIDSSDNSLVLEDKVSSAKGRRVVIVRSAQATLSEKYAAHELSEYLGKITGSSVTVKNIKEINDDNTDFIIAVGKNRFTENLDISGLGIEDYIIDITPMRLLIVGGRKAPIRKKQGLLFRDRGTLYGVYEFLEQLGVRWYRPEKWGEHVPDMKKIILPCCRKTYRRKGFPVRTSFSSGINISGVEKGKSSEMLSKWRVRNHSQNRGEHYGGSYPLCGRRFGGGHVYFKIISPKKYFKTHPEYFALIRILRGLI